jgi:hypothetical protein
MGYNFAQTFDRRYVRNTRSTRTQEAAMSTMTVAAGPGFGRSGGAARPGGAQQRLAAQSGIRLTRRGRLLLTLVVGALVAVVAVLALGSPSAGAGAGAGQPLAATSYERVTVEPGQTLWALANEIAPSEDPREVVAQIMDLNAMSSSNVQAGEVLLIPR